MMSQGSRNALLIQSTFDRRQVFQRNAPLSNTRHVFLCHAPKKRTTCLFPVFTITSIILGLLSLDTTGAAATEWGGKGKVNVFLGVEADDEGGDIDDLPANADVTLADENSSMVNGLCKTHLVDTRLEAALEKVFHLESKDVVELHAGLVQHADTDQTANERVAFKDALGILLVEGQKLTSSTTDLGESQLDAPDLALVAQAVVPNNPQLGIKTSRLVGPAGDLGGLGVDKRGHAWELESASKTVAKMHASLSKVALTDMKNNN